MGVLDPVVLFRSISRSSYRKRRALGTVSSGASRCDRLQVGRCEHVQSIFLPSPTNGPDSIPYGTTNQMDYQPVVVKKYPHISSNKSNHDSRYWRQYRHPVFIKEYAPVTSIHFSPSKPYRYAVTAATRVQIYAPRTQKVTKTISRFKDVARSGNIRLDGKLVIAGDDTGLVQVFRIH